MKLSVRNGKTVSLIIPAKNEAKNLTQVLDDVPDFVDQVLIVDGHSIDDTVQVASRHERVSSVIPQRNKGKGAALSRGFFASTSDIVVMVDADGSMDLAEIGAFVDAVSKGALIVKGSRNLKGGGSDDITKFRSLGNMFLTKLANLLYGQNWTDLAYGYAAFDKSALEICEIKFLDTKVAGALSHRRMSYGQGFEIETLIFCRAIRRGIEVVEIPSWERNRVFGSSNLRAISDGTRALAALIFEKLRSRRALDA